MERFDYIVIGAGSAGCVLAHRLSDGGQHRVLLLEAGDRARNPWLHIPLGFGRLYGNPRYNWLFETEPENALGGRRAVITRGRVLGGSSAVNGLVYIRGQREDFDNWSARGNAGWSYREVLPYFRRSEHQARGPDEFHGAGGPLSVSDAADSSELCDAFIEACSQAGIAPNFDFNGARQEGAGYLQVTAANGLRCSTATAYLRPAGGRVNLDVRTGALAARVVLEGRQAVGVDYVMRGERHHARADREVILAAGAIGSPQILQLSGIGPPEVLEKTGVPVLAALPGVGRNLQDHYSVSRAYRCRKRVTLNDAFHSVAGRVGMGLRYVLLRRGWLAQAAGQAACFFRTEESLMRPDMQVHLKLFSTAPGTARIERHSGFSTALYHLRPDSRGSVEIRSADPAQAPRIWLNYFATPADRTTIARGVRRLEEVMRGPALKDYIEPDRLDLSCSSDAEAFEYARTHGATAGHFSCSCRMGSDSASVVDARLRVHDVAGLRVADASIMPNVVSGNTNAATIMIAEKASDLVLEDA